MKTQTKILAVLAVALLSLGAKCSDCQKATLTANAICQAQGEASAECVKARAEAEKACTPVTPPTPVPPPGHVCAEGEFCACWHNPTGEEWILAICPNGQECTATLQCVASPPPVTCPESCPAGQECKDPKVGCVPIPPPPPVAGLILDEELVGQPDQGGIQTWAATEAAIKRYQAKHPEKWVALSGGTCLVAGASGIDEAFASIASELASASVVAGQSITKAGKRSDALFVNRTGTDLYEEMHLFDYSRACVATGPNAYRGLYRRTTSTSDVCPATPCPPRVYADTGKPHWHFNAKPHTMGNGDSTPVVDKVCDYCKSVGLGDSGTPGVPRCACPVRPDGHPDRMAVEAWLTEGGIVRDGRNGQDCTPNNTDNPAAFLYGTGNCRVCNTPKTVCSAWM